MSAQLPRDRSPPELTDPAIGEYVARATGDAKIQLRDSTWLSLYRPNVRLAQRFRVGRVFLAGDAAHVHLPTGGQGLNTGVQDAYNLGWKLAHVLRGAPATLLDTYEEERLPIAASVLGIATELYKKATSRSSARTSAAPPRSSSDSAIAGARSPAPPRPQRRRSSPEIALPMRL